MQMLNDSASVASANYQVHKFGSEPHDLCVRIGLQSFNLHRSVVEMKSKYFFDLMKNKPPTAVTDLVLEDVSEGIFLDICRWMYGSQLQIAAPNFCAVWHASKKLHILDLVEKCRCYLSSIGSQHRAHHVQQRNFQESETNKRIQPLLKSGKTVTFAPEVRMAGHRPPLTVAEKRSELEGTPKRKPVSLEKLLSKQTVVNITTVQKVLCENVSDEWLTISEEEFIGAETVDSLPKLLRGKVPATYEDRLPLSAELQRSYKVTENPEMVLVKTCELPKLAFLVDRSHLVLNSRFLKSELGNSGRNCVTLHHTDNQTVSNILQWSLGGSQPLMNTNIRASLQLTSQLQMTKLSAKCLDFWRKCIHNYAAKAPAEVNSVALVALARFNWPLLGPYPFLINLVASRTNLLAEEPLTKPRVREGMFNHSQILVKALTGRNPQLPKTINIPSSTITKKVVADPAYSPSKPTIPASIKILGLRRTLELLNSRKTRSKPTASNTEVPGHKSELEKKAVPPLQASALDSTERKVSQNPATSNKTATSLRLLANRRDFVRKKIYTEKEIK